MYGVSQNIPHCKQHGDALKYTNRRWVESTRGMKRMRGWWRRKKEIIAHLDNEWGRLKWQKAQAAKSWKLYKSWKFAYKLWVCFLSRFEVVRAIYNMLKYFHFSAFCIPLMCAEKLKMKMPIISMLTCTTNRCSKIVEPWLISTRCANDGMYPLFKCCKSVVTLKGWLSHIAEQ